MREGYRGSYKRDETGNLLSRWAGLNGNDKRSGKWHRFSQVSGWTLRLRYSWLSTRVVFLPAFIFITKITFFLFFIFFLEKKKKSKIKNLKFEKINKKKRVIGGACSSRSAAHQLHLPTLSLPPPSNN